MVLASTRAPHNDFHQCLCPHNELQLPPASLGESKSSVGMLGPFQITASVLDPRACEILCVPFKSGISFSQPSGLQKLSHAGLQSQMFWCLSSQCRTPRLGSSVWTPTPCSLERTSVIVIILLFGGCPPGDMGVTVLQFCPSYLSYCVFLFISLVVHDLFW